MPYVKSISVHSTPKKTIKYILNPDKTENLLYASGINCSAVADIVYNEMKDVFEDYSKHSFDENKAINSKTPVKLFHFIQSFRPTDEITPELAHKIADEWAKKAFGKDRQILIATHVDKGHVHSHIIINPYDLNGIKYNDNQKTLNAVKSLSDTIALQYGIEPIPKSKVRKGVSYKEWAERKKGTSWKQQIKDSIDRLVYEVKSLDELYQKLTEQGYIVKRKKHTTVSIPTAENEKKKSVRIDNAKTFGEGYGDESLEQRIALAKEQKEAELKRSEAAEKEKNMNPLERLYTRRIYEVGQLVRNGEKVAKKYTKKLPYSVENDYEVYRLAKQLQIIKRDSISSINQLERMMDEVGKAYESARQELNKANEKQRQFALVIENAEIYQRLKSIPLTELSQADRLKLKLADNVVSKSGIKNESDLEKIKKAYEINEQRITHLNMNFEALERRYSEYADISEKYKDITRNDYISRLIEEKKRLDRKTDLQ